MIEDTAESEKALADLMNDLTPLISAKPAEPLIQVMSNNLYQQILEHQQGGSE